MSRDVGGGVVFSVGSINFGGSLAVDPDLQQIVRNVLATESAPPAVPGLQGFGLAPGALIAASLVIGLRAAREIRAS